jgi:hypothetical protein
LILLLGGAFLFNGTVQMGMRTQLVQAMHLTRTMKVSPGVVCAVVLVGVIPVHRVGAQGQQASGTLTIKVTSALVFLDITVLDKKGHPVVSG